MTNVSKRVKMANRFKKSKWETGPRQHVNMAKLSERVN